MIVLQPNQPVKVPNGLYLVAATIDVDIWVSLDGTHYVKLINIPNDTARPVTLPTCHIKRNTAGGHVAIAWIGRF